MNEIVEFFFIGYAGEKNARRKPIDISDLQTRWPDATPILMVNRPKESAPYPATTTVEGSVLYWEVAEIDVAKSGFGQAQVFMRDSDGNVLGKSAVMNTLVKTSLNGTEQENPPPALETWIAKFLEAYEGLGGGNNSGGSSVAIDTTLTQSGKAADAKATGDALNELKEAIGEELDSLNEEIEGLKENGGAGVAVDATLTESGKAADAAVVGQRITEIDNAIFDTAPGKNLFNPATVAVGYLKTDGTLSTYGSNVNYDTSDYIKVATNTSYTVTTVKNDNHSIMTSTKVVHLYDDSKQSISDGHFEAKSQQTLTFNTGNAAYVRVSGQTRAAVDGDNVCSVQLEKGDTFTGYEPYSVLNKVPKIVSPGILYGKKYVACGDSFTAGDFTGYVDENGLSGKNSPVLYDSDWKMYKTYPWWIANRNNMTLVLDAQNGTTMALDKTYVADPENVDINTRNPFANERYKRIPSDADYITIWFGLNDANGNTNLGTIDDTDNTTFYGAWNVVLEYLLINHPYAKVGIIVTDGRTDSEYQDAVREVAKKWGFPYLDLVADPQVPAMISGRDAEMGLCARAKELRDAAFRVSADNFHPSIKAHEYRSTIIENWLRTL